MTKKWINTGNGNQILKNGDFYISYNKDPQGSEMAEICGSILSLASGNSDFNESREETALVKEGEKYQFLILNGDFRKDYEKLIDKGYKECKKFYNKNKKKYQSIWSSDYE